MNKTLLIAGILSLLSLALLSDEGAETVPAMTEDDPPAIDESSGRDGRGRFVKRRPAPSHLGESQPGQSQPGQSQPAEREPDAQQEQKQPTKTTE